MRPRRPLSSLARLALAGVLASLVASCGGERSSGPAAVSGRVPPALVADGATWFQAPVNPSLASFQGKVVFLEFGFLR